MSNESMRDPFVQRTDGNERAAGDLGRAGLKPVLREQADKIAGRSRDAGIGAARVIGKAAETASQELEESSPELANYVRGAARYTQELADHLSDRAAADLLADAVAWSRRQPLTALAGAAFIGFALSRVIKIGRPQ
jgi:hypothetical protein